MLTFDEYQDGAVTTAMYPIMMCPDSIDDHPSRDLPCGFVYPIIGLAGEVGELSEKCKKIIRDSQGHVSEAVQVEVKKEIGDVLWYVAMLCKEFGFDMGDVAQMNLDKLKSRKERGKIQGSGDNR